MAGTLDDIRSVQKPYPAKQMTLRDPELVRRAPRATELHRGQVTRMTRANAIIRLRY